VESIFSRSVWAHVLDCGHPRHSEYWLQHGTLNGNTREHKGEHSRVDSKFYGAELFALVLIASVGIVHFKATFLPYLRDDFEGFRATVEKSAWLEERSDAAHSARDFFVHLPNLPGASKPGEAYMVAWICRWGLPGSRLVSWSLPILTLFPTLWRDHPGHCFRILPPQMNIRCRPPTTALWP
jgi:hypothetical protein